MQHPRAPACPPPTRVTATVPALEGAGLARYPGSCLVFDSAGNYVGTPQSAVVVGAADQAGTAPATTSHPAAGRTP